MDVLIVDNDKEYRSVLGEILFLYGHEVTLASSGEEAIDLLRSRQFDVVVSDINMPGIDGTKLHGLVRTNPLWKDMPFVYISGYPNLRGSAVIADAGRDFVLGKMTPIQELLELLNDLSGKGPMVPLIRKDRMGSASGYAQNPTTS